MWDAVGIIAAIVVIVLLLQVLDITDSLVDRMRGRVPRKDMETKIDQLEKRLAEIERKVG